MTTKQPGKLWEIHVYGDLPQCFENIEAATREGAIAAVVSEILARLEFKAHPKDQAGPELAPTPGGEEKAKT